MIVSWFSAGISSAVATKIVIDQVDKIIYQHVDDQHEDTLRFLKDCEKWFGKPIEVIQSPFKTVENVVLFTRWVRGPSGAACSRMLKKELRMQWESDNPGLHTYVWGMDYDKDEVKRAGNRTKAVPYMNHLFPLIENKITKPECHAILEKAKISRPKMYELGYPNNNCVGCLKGGMGYWNKIRVDFPEVFASRAKLERIIGASCLRKEKKKLFLDELDPNAGRDEGIIIPECGAYCERIIDDEETL
jgi:hypothetical protein